MKLYLVQHGRALDKSEDPRRPLSERGRTDVEAVAGFLQRASVTVSRVEHSGKDRAAETPTILARAVADSNVVERSGIAPNDPVAPFVTEVNGLDADLMVVGHLPFLARAVSSLITGAEEPPVFVFKQGGVACLERDDGGQWSVAWMIVPGLLPRVPICEPIYKCSLVLEHNHT